MVTWINDDAVWFHFWIARSSQGIHWLLLLRGELLQISKMDLSFELTVVMLRLAQNNPLIYCI